MKYRGIALWRWAENYSAINRIFHFTPLQKILIYFTLGRSIRTGSYFHGLGRHPTPEIHRMVQDDLKTVSKILGNNKFIGGNEISEEDCAIFGCLSQCLWGLPGSPYEKIMKSQGKYFHIIYTSDSVCVTSTIEFNSF